MQSSLLIVHSAGRVVPILYLLLFSWSVFFLTHRLKKEKKRSLVKIRRYKFYINTFSVHKNEQTTQQLIFYLQNCYKLLKRYNKGAKIGINWFLMTFFCRFILHIQPNAEWIKKCDLPSANNCGLCISSLKFSAKEASFIFLSFCVFAVKWCVTHRNKSSDIIIQPSGSLHPFAACHFWVQLKFDLQKKKNSR